MDTCPACGASVEVVPEDNKCPKCGADLKDESDAGSPESESSGDGMEEM